MNKIIDGKILALYHQQQLQLKINKIENFNVKIVDFCSFKNKAAEKYLQLKASKARELGINFQLVNISRLVLDDLVNQIKLANQDPEVFGIMFQLPLPRHLSVKQKQLLNLIDLKKDIDGLGENSLFNPATVKGVVSILTVILSETKNMNNSVNLYPSAMPPVRLNRTQDDKWENKLFAIVGSEGFIGKSMVKALKKLEVKIIEVDQKKEKSSLDDLKTADIVISCVGQRDLIKAEHIKKGVILIDVGLGDFDETCFEKASFYTPKIGGVGPMTIISLMENIVEAVEKSAFSIKATSRLHSKNEI